MFYNLYKIQNKKVFFKTLLFICNFFKETKKNNNLLTKKNCCTYSVN